MFLPLTREEIGKILDIQLRKVGENAGRAGHHH